jgi:hypothetical protein
MLNIVAAGAAALAMAAPSSLIIQTPLDAPPTDKMVIEVVTVNGTGCPIGTAAVAVSPDNTAFTVTYSEYVAEVAPGLPASASRKNCQLNLNVHVPSGFTYAINQTDYRGYASIAAGATATERASYYFQGSTATGAITNTIVGPYEDVWQYTDYVAVASMVWRPCGGDQRNLNINTSLVVSKGRSGTANSYMVMDSTDGSLSTIYHFNWARC